jgi:hypothetical protein
MWRLTGVVRGLQSAMTTRLRMSSDALVEEQPVWTMLDGDAEEVGKRPEVLHGKFPLKSGNSATQKLRAGRSQDDIINI